MFEAVDSVRTLPEIVPCTSSAVQVLTVQRIFNFVSFMFKVCLALELGMGSLLHPEALKLPSGANTFVGSNETCVVRFLDKLHSIVDLHAACPTVPAYALFSSKTSTLACTVFRRKFLKFGPVVGAPSARGIGACWQCVAGKRLNRR